MQDDRLIERFYPPSVQPITTKPLGDMWRDIFKQGLNALNTAQLTLKQRLRVFLTLLRRCLHHLRNFAASSWR